MDTQPDTQGTPKAKRRNSSGPQSLAPPCFWICLSKSALCEGKFAGVGSMRAVWTDGRGEIVGGASMQREGTRSHRAASDAPQGCDFSTYLVQGRQTRAG